MKAGTGTALEPRAYAGLAFSYFEQVTEGWKRMSDLEWHDKLNQNPPPVDVPWTGDFLGE